MIGDFTSFGLGLDDNDCDKKVNTDSKNASNIYDFIAGCFIVFLIIFSIVAYANFTNDIFLDRNDEKIIDKIGRIEVVLNSIANRKN